MTSRCGPLPGGGESRLEISARLERHARRDWRRRQLRVQPDPPAEAGDGRVDLAECLERQTQVVTCLGGVRLRVAACNAVSAPGRSFVHQRVAPR